jgi:hypothetical protein
MAATMQPLAALPMTSTCVRCVGNCCWSICLHRETTGYVVCNFIVNVIGFRFGFSPLLLAGKKKKKKTFFSQKNLDNVGANSVLEAHVVSDLS